MKSKEEPKDKVETHLKAEDFKPNTAFKNKVFKYKDNYVTRVTYDATDANYIEISSKN